MQDYAYFVSKTGLVGNFSYSDVYLAWLKQQTGQSTGTVDDLSALLFGGAGGERAYYLSQLGVAGTGMSISDLRNQFVSNVTPTALQRLMSTSAAQASVRPVRWIFDGSSTTAGNNATVAVNRYVNLLAVAAQAAWPSGLGSEYATTGLATAAGSPSSSKGIQVINNGIGGTSADTYLTSTALGQHTTLAPDGVFIMVGTNDERNGVTPATFKTNLQTSITNLKGAIPANTPIVVTASYGAFDATYAYPWGQYVQAMSDIVAADPQLTLVDISGAYALLGVPPSGQYGSDTMHLIDTDNLHQTDRGHSYMAELLRQRYGIPGSAIPLKPFIDTVAPSVPGTPVATAGTSSASLTWAASTDNSGAVDHYNVYSSADGYTTPVGSSTTTSVTISGLASTAVTFEVTAVDVAGNASAKSAASNSVTPISSGSSDTAAPTVPTNVNAAPGNTQASLSWTASTDDTAVTGYKIYNGGALATTVGNVTSGTVTGLTNGTIYSFTVSAIDAAGNESAQSAASRTVPGTVYDGFQRADASNLGNADSGQTYAYPANSGISDVISSKAARQMVPYVANTASTTNKSQNIIPAPASDFIAFFRVKTAPSSAANGSGGFQFRTAADGSAYCYVSFRQSSSALGVSLVKVTAAGATTGGPSVITAGTTVLVAGDIVKLVVSGTTATVYINGSSTAAVTGTVPTNTNLYLGPYTSGAFDGALDMLVVV